MDILVLFQILVGRLSTFHHWSIMLAPGLYHNKYLLLCRYTHFGKSLSWVDVEFYQILFCIYWDDHTVFVFSFFDVVHYIDWFVHVELPLWTWDESHLFVVYDLFFMCCWIWFADMLLRIFASVNEVKVLVAQLCLTLCDPMDCSPPGSSVCGILQVRILE